MKKSKRLRLSLSIDDEDFIKNMNAYSEYKSMTKSEAIYSLAQKGFKETLKNWSENEMKNFEKIKEMLQEIEKHKSEEK